MDAKDAIREAKGLVKELYADEDIAEIRLEELEFEDVSDSWLVTLGLLRPTRGTSDDRPGLLRSQPLLKRTYKVVKIPNDNLARESMKIREMTGDCPAIVLDAQLLTISASSRRTTCRWMK